MAVYPSFPELSRKPALKTGQKTLSRTLSDSYENGMESSRARWTRRRRERTYTIEALTPADVEALDNFVENVAEDAANIFTFPDPRDPKNPATLLVRFSVTPSYTDAGNIAGEWRQNCTFTLREV